jgi:hypothetical protein
VFAVALGVEGLIDLGALAAFCFMVALDFAYALTIGLLLLAIANALDDVGNHLGPLGFLFSTPGGWITDLNNTIHASLGTGIQATEYAWHKVFNFTASTITGIGEAMAYLANETYRELDRLWRDSIPAYVISQVRPLIRDIANIGHTAVSATKAVPAEITKIYKVTKTYPRTIEVEVPKIARAAVNVKAIAAAVAGELTLPRWGRIEHDIEGINKRLAKLANVAGIGTLAGLGAYALAKLGLTETQCSGAKRWNKGMCSTNPNVLEDLLLGLTAIFGTLSLVKLAEDYQKLIPDVSKSVQHFWRADVAGKGADRQIGTPGAVS